MARTYSLGFEPDRIREIVRARLARPTAPTTAPKGERSQPKKADEGEPEVKGFMTLNEIELKTRVPADYLLRRLALPEDIDARVPVREWMHQHGKSIQDLRDAVDEYRRAK